MLFLLHGFFFICQYANTRITIKKRVRGATIRIQIESKKKKRKKQIEYFYSASKKS